VTVQDDLDAEQPWREIERTASERADLLLEILTVEEKVRVAVGDVEVLSRYGVPRLMSKDGPNGIALPGTTSFPSGYSVASTFDRTLAQRLGQAIGTELRGKGRAVWLGPAVDIARTPFAGRQSESFGEDPVLSGVMARAAVLGAKSTNTIQTVKHFAANNQETGRIGYRANSGSRTPAIDIRVDERALQEIYASPFREAMRDGGAGAVMASYNRVNGDQACESRALLGPLKNGWRGVVTPDYVWAVRDQIGAFAAGIDLPQFDQGTGGRTEDDVASMPRSRLDDAVRRVLFMVFDSGLYDHPLPDVEADDVSTPDHRDLARRIAAEGMVVLKNDGVLPLDAPTISTIAVIGASGHDAIFTIGGSAAVTVSPDRLRTPASALVERLDKHAVVLKAQGSIGDRMSPFVIPEVLLAAPGDAGGSGWEARYWSAMTPDGTPSVQRTEAVLFEAGRPEQIGDNFAARWTTRLTPRESGIHYFSILFSGSARLTVDGFEVAAGEREEAVFLAGPELPIIGSANLVSGKTVTVVVDYSTSSAGAHSPTIGLTWFQPSDSFIAEATDAASRAEVAVVIVNSTSSEGMDRTSLSLPGDQDRLVEATIAVNPRTIVVANVGGPVLTPWVDRAAAVVVSWYPGQAFGDALGDVLFGDVAGLGRLPVSFPWDDADPSLTGLRPRFGADHDDYEDGLAVGYRRYSKQQPGPRFAFGHGLEYSSFKYSELEATFNADHVHVAFDIRNQGSRTATATPQVYADPHPTDEDSDARVLVGFARIPLRAGEVRRVAISIPGERLRAWKTGGWSEPWPWREYHVGESYSDTRLQFDLTGRGSK
jgi:beta-glucosidase